MREHIIRSVSDNVKLLEIFLQNSQNIEKINQLGKLIAGRFSEGNKIIIFGNGGSSCDAAHFAEEFTGRYRKNRKALPVIVINESSHLSCVANDYGFDQVFYRGVEAFSKKGDVVIGLSTSGNSQNVKLGLDLAKSLGGITVALLGKDGGKMKHLYDYEWIVSAQTSDRVQEIHMTILHILIEIVERHLFPDHYS